MQIYNSGLKTSAISVYLYLLSRADKDKKCWPSKKRIANDLNLSLATVKRAIRELEKNNFLRREYRYRDNKGNTSNMYYLS